jgi:hypothetical protein
MKIKWNFKKKKKNYLVIFRGETLVNDKWEHRTPVIDIKDELIESTEDIKNIYLHMRKTFPLMRNIEITFIMEVKK